MERLPRSVRLFSEYGAESPIWTTDGDIPPEDIGLSARLSVDLRAWQNHFEKHFHHETGWDSHASRDWYADQVEPLRKALEKELGDGVQLTVSLWPLQ